MGHYLRSAIDGVKKTFSATESFVLQLQKAFLAVRDVLKFHRPSESKQPFQETSTKDSTSNNSKCDNSVGTRHGVFRCMYFPCIARCPGQYQSPTAENSTGSVCSKHCVFCTFFASFCWTHGLCPKYCLQTFILVSCLFLFYLCCVYNNDYVSKVLVVIENTDVEVAIMIFLVLIIIACLPLVWGYVVLNMAAGYRFGLFYGVFLVMVSVTIGLSLTHRFSQKFCNGCVTRALRCYDRQEYISGILKVLDGPSGLKVVALARLTPIPFGLQNGIFSLANIKTRYYVAASNIGLLPTQIINCYMGSTFHSGQDIIDQGGSFSGYTIFILQVVAGIGLMTYVVRRARRELASVLISSNSEVCESVPSSDEHELIEVRVSQPTTVTII